MDLYKKKYLYSNGTSITAGGGFEEYEYRTDVRLAYNKKNIELPKTQLECSYPFFIAKDLGLQLINDAKSGSGIARLIRTTTQWITNNSDKIDETIFLLEIQQGIRLDWYVKQWNDYGILNAHKDINGDYPFTIVKDWYKDDIEIQQKWNNLYHSHISGWLNNFYDEDEYIKNDVNSILSFITFLNYKKIDFIISYNKDTFESIKSDIDNLIKYEQNINNIFNNDVWSYARDNQLLILNEVNSSDNHIGYSGNQKIGKFISNFIKKPFNLILLTGSKAAGLPFTLFKNSDVNVILTDNIDTANIVYLEEFNSKFEFGNTKLIEYLEKYKTNPKFHKMYFLIPLMHEIFELGGLEKKIKFLTDFGLNSDKLINFDVSLNGFQNRSSAPMELKLKQFNFFDLIPFEYSNNRDKKFTFLCSKISHQRFYIITKILEQYQNTPIKLKEDNIISIRDKTNSNNGIVPNDGIFNKYRPLIEKFNFPWILEDDSNFDNLDNISELFLNIYNKYTNSVFSIITETENTPYLLNYIHAQMNETTLPVYDYSLDQVSEKAIIAFSAGNLPFVIYDSIYYKQLEGIGFDFSYLKTIFDIDYMNNTVYQNYNEIGRVISFIKTHSIDELNTIRMQHMNMIKNNVDRIKQIMFGGLSDNEKKWLKQIMK